MISVVNCGYKAVPVFLSRVSQRSLSQTRGVDMTVALSLTSYVVTDGILLC